MESIMICLVLSKQGLGIFVSFLSTVAIRRVSLVHSIHTSKRLFSSFSYLRCDCVNLSRAVFNNSIHNCEMLIVLASTASRQNVCSSGPGKKISLLLVQPLNSPFFAPPIEAEPRLVKREFRITCMRMLRTRRFYLQIGGNHIWKNFPDSACGAIFWIIACKQQCLHSDWLKTCQLIPNQWNFTSATLNDVQYQR